MIAPVVGDFVKPAGFDGTWRLGVVETIDEKGVYSVRLYVAPPGAYEGQIHHAKAKELTVLSADQVNGALVTTRAIIASKQQLARQIDEAMQAAKKLREG